MLEQSAWPHPYGNADHTRVSSQLLTSQGQPLWSAQLAAALASEILVRANGRCFVASRRYLTAIEQDGHIDWTVEAALKEQHLPLAMSGAKMLRLEIADYSDPALVIRDQATGEVTRRLAAGGIAYAALARRAGIVAVIYSREGCALRMLTLEGSELWRLPLDRPREYQPLVSDDGIAVIDGLYAASV